MWFLNSEQTAWFSLNHELVFDWFILCNVPYHLHSFCRTKQCCLIKCRLNSAILELLYWCLLISVSESEVLNWNLVLLLGLNRIFASGCSWTSRSFWQMFEAAAAAAAAEAKAALNSLDELVLWNTVENECMRLQSQKKKREKRGCASTSCKNAEVHLHRSFTRNVPSRGWLVWNIRKIRWTLRTDEVDGSTEYVLWIWLFTNIQYIR